MNLLPATVAFLSALAVGFGAARLLPPDAPTEAPGPPPSLAPEPPLAAASPAAFWRQRFLAILDEPSASQRMAAYYALATEIPSREFAAATRALYPEGWARFRGDLPLAISMEWIRNGGDGLAATIQSLHHEHPDLEDNWDGIFFNLGLQGERGALPVLQAIANPELKSVLVNAFVDGVRDAHPEQLFSVRLELLGPQFAFGQLSEHEFDEALAAFWQDPVFYLERHVVPEPRFWLALGKRYGLAAGERFEAPTNPPALRMGIALSDRSLSDQELAAVLETWTPAYRDLTLLSDDEARAFLRRAVRLPSVASKLYDYNSASLWQRGLDRPLCEAILSQVPLDPQLRAVALEQGARLYRPEELVLRLEGLPSFARDRVLNAHTLHLPPHEQTLLLDSLPDAWLTDPLAEGSLAALLQAENRDGLRALAARLPNLGPPTEPHLASQLWELDPEFYLDQLLALPAPEQRQQLAMIASFAHEEELPTLLQATDLEEQSALVLALLADRPNIGLAILQADPSLQLTAEQAAQLGPSIAFNGSPDAVRDFFASRPPDDPASQIAFLSYCLHESPLAPEAEIAQQLAASSPLRDYVYRFAQSLDHDSASLETLHALRQENPSRFLETFRLALDATAQPRVRQRAEQLLRSDALSDADRLALYAALYGNPAP